jgi:quercetin dioxygenase-like cupin family protein
MDESVFREHLARDGFEKVGIVEWEADKVSGKHVHDFDAFGMLLEGGMTVETDAAAMVCQPGDTFKIAANTPHTEKVGKDGARVLIGRRVITSSP